MDKFDRIHDLHRIFSGRRTVVALEDLRKKLGGCSRSTVMRLVALLRDQLGAPVAFDRDLMGYRYELAPDGRAYELPGLWFNAQAPEGLRQTLTAEFARALAQYRADGAAR